MKIVRSLAQASLETALPFGDLRKARIQSLQPPPRFKVADANADKSESTSRLLPLAGRECTFVMFPSFLIASAVAATLAGAFLSRCRGSAGCFHKADFRPSGSAGIRLPSGELRLGAEIGRAGSPSGLNERV